MPGRIIFSTRGEGSAEQFVREYVLDVIDRVAQIEGCERVAFGLDRHPNSDGGRVTLDVFGDAEAFFDHEQEEWEHHQNDGLITGWETSVFDRKAMEAEMGEKGAQLSIRLTALADRMATLVYDEYESLDDLPAALNTYPDEGTQAGWWIVPHHIAFASLDYSATEELAMHRGGIAESLRLLAEREGKDEVDDQIDDLIDALEEMRDDVKQGRNRGG